VSFLSSLRGRRANLGSWADRLSLHYLGFFGVWQPFVRKAAVLGDFRKSGIRVDVTQFPEFPELLIVGKKQN